MRFYVPLFFLCLVVAVSASPRRVDHSKRSPLAEQKTEFDTRNPRPEINKRFKGKTMEIQEWHGNFTTLGEKKSPLQDERAPMNREQVKMDKFEKETVDLQKSPDNRRMATIRNWNSLKEQVMSSKFTNTELRTPEGRRFQEMVDELSLRDIQRFVTQKNVTDKGIPTVQPGSGESLKVNAE